MLREGYSQTVTLAWMNHVSNEFANQRSRARTTTPDNSSDLAALGSIAGLGRELLRKNPKAAPLILLGEEIGKLLLTPSTGWNLMEQGDAQRRVADVNQESIYISKYAADVLGVEASITNPSGATDLFDRYLQGRGIVDYSLRDGLDTVYRKNPQIKSLQLLSELDKKLENAGASDAYRHREIRSTLKDILNSSQEAVEFAKREEARRLAEARRAADYNGTVVLLNETQAASAILIRVVGISNPQEARRLQTVADVAFTAMRLQHDFNFQKIGAFALANGYLGAALVITDLLSKSGPSTDEIIVSQLAAISRQVAELRQEIGIFEGRVQLRFNELQSTLRQMYFLIDVDLKRLLLATENLEQEATRIGNQLRTLGRQLASVQGALIRAIKTTAEFPFYERREACLWARVVDGPGIPYDAYSACANTFTTWATTTSIAMAQIQPAGEVDVSNLQALINRAASLGNVDAQRFHASVPDPNIWAQSTQAYLALMSDWPQYAYGFKIACAGDKECQKRNSAVDISRLRQVGQIIEAAQTGLFLLADGTYYTKTQVPGGFVEYKNPTAAGLRQMLTTSQLQLLQAFSDTAWDYIDRSMYGLDPWFLGDVTGRQRVAKPQPTPLRQDIQHVRPTQLTQAAMQAVRFPVARQCKGTSVPKPLSRASQQLAFVLPENINDILPPFVLYTALTTKKPFSVHACFDLLSAVYKDSRGRLQYIESFDQLQGVNVAVQVSLRISAGFSSDKDRGSEEADWRALGKNEIFSHVSTVQAWDIPVDFRQQPPMKTVVDQFKAELGRKIEWRSLEPGISAVNFTKDQLLPEMRRQVIAHIRSEFGNDGSRLASAYQDFFGKLMQANAIVLQGLFPESARLDSAAVEALAASVSGMTGPGLESMLESAIDIEKRIGGRPPTLVQRGELTPNLPAGIGSMPAESVGRSLERYLAVMDRRIEDLARSINRRSAQPPRIVSSEVRSLLTRLDLLSVGLEMLDVPPATPELNVLPEAVATGD